MARRTNPVLASVAKQAREEARRLVATRLETARQAARVAGLLAQAGIPVTFNSAMATYPYFELKLDQLTTARNILGKFEHSSTEIYDDTHVQVKLRCVQYPRVRLSYIRELPAGSKCRIVEQTCSYQSKSLVCQR